MKLALHLSFLVILTAVKGSEILVVLHTVSRSHDVFAAPLLKTLAERNHQLTVITPFPSAIKMANYHEILTPAVLNEMKKFIGDLMKNTELSIIQRMTSTYKIGSQICNFILGEPEVKLLLTSGKKFDLIILDVLMNEAMLGFGHHFQAPVIALSVFHPTIWSYDLVGVPAPLSYVPTPFADLGTRMDFLERLRNVYYRTFERILNDFIHLPGQEAVYSDYFPDPKPSLYDLRKNVSLVLVNSHFAISYARPTAPNFIEIGGIQINRTRTPLPSDLQQFLDSAKEGAVYFSLGTNVKSSVFSSDTLNSILKVFASRKEKIIFKWENSTVAVGIENVLVKDWLPQDDILAHPNIKLFITHGGLLSITEAIYHGVPILGIPVFNDQFLNIQQATRSGIGLMLSLAELDEFTFRTKFNEALENPSYTENCKKMSLRYRDQPLQPLETAVYWIEYVIRHQGAPHLRSAAQDLSFIELYCLDILALVISLILLFFYVLVRFFKLVLSLMYDPKQKNKVL